MKVLPRALTHSADAQRLRNTSLYEYFDATGLEFEAAAGKAPRRRVLDAVERQGYRPSLTASALVERKAPTLALMLSCITNPC